MIVHLGEGEYWAVETSEAGESAKSVDLRKTKVFFSLWVQELKYWTGVDNVFWDSEGYND